MASVPVAATPPPPRRCPVPETGSTENRKRQSPLRERAAVPVRKKVTK
jgi:hypothetical protein